MAGKPIYAALLEVQRELKAPKGQYNSFAKYHYRSAEDIIEAAKPLCHKSGLILTLSDEPCVSEGWHYIKATATVIDIATGDSYSATAYAREPQAKKGSDESQITGASSSYARKYALNGLFAIDDTKDADTDEYTKTGNAPNSRQNRSQAQGNAKQGNHANQGQNAPQTGAQPQGDPEHQAAKQRLWDAIRERGGDAKADAAKVNTWAKARMQFPLDELTAATLDKITAQLDSILGDAA